MIKRNVALIFSLTLVFSLSACQGKKPASTAKPSETKVSATTTKESPGTVATSSVTKDGITLLETAVCESIENRTCGGASAQFPATVGRVYLLTKMKIDAAGDLSVKHVWYHAGKELATVTLPVRGPTWRTYSSKAIDITQKGEWKVDVMTSNNEILQSITFRIQ